MKIVCISDTHSRHFNLKIPDGDILIHAGDFTELGTTGEINRFLLWFESQPHPHKILIAGNHEVLLDRKFYDKSYRRFHKRYQEPRPIISDNIHYLENSSVEISIEGNERISSNGTTIRERIKIYGSPYSIDVGWAFQYPETDANWGHISLDADIVITHSPPKGVMDVAFDSQMSYGCQKLLERIELVKPKLHVFGHVHDGHGMITKGETTFVNACIVNDSHLVVHAPIVVEISDI
jgi:Calcineurin-like phosphoesterase